MWEPSIHLQRSRVQPDEALRRREVAQLVSELHRLWLKLGVAEPPAGAEEIRHTALVQRVDPRRAIPELHGIQIAQRTSAGAATWITFVDAAGADARWLSHATAWAVQPLLVELLARLHGDEREVDAALAGEVPLLPHSTFVHPDGWWPSFKGRDLVDDDLKLSIGQVYEQALYPPVCEALAGRGARVLDLGAGDGVLAGQLLRSGAAREVVLIERNEELLDRARRELAGLHATVCAGDLRMDRWAIGVEGRFDAVVAVGVFESNVLDTATVARAVPLAAELLTPGGLWISSGTGASLVNTALLRRHGLGVENQTLPPPSPVRAAYPHYVARRPL